MNSEQLRFTILPMARIAIVVLVLGVVAAASCGGDEVTPPANGGTSSTTVYFLRDGKIAPVRRELPTTPELERAALTTLIEGPTDDETARGLVSAIPAGTKLLGLSLDRGVAIVDLSGAFDDGGGSASMLGRIAQVVATLTRFPGVQRVGFELDGERVTAIGGEGVVVDPPIGRRAIEEQTPQILIESPLSGDAVSNPVRLRGTANVFEANVSIEVRDETGTVILEAFTTATSGTGTRGTFDTKLSVPTGPGKLTIVAFEASAEDGRPLHAVDVQVTLEP